MSERQGPALMIHSVINFGQKLGRLAADRSRWRSLGLFYLFSIPFRLRLRRIWPGTYVSAIPDRYSLHRPEYLANGGYGRPWQPNDFLHGNAVNNGADMGRWYFLHLICDQILDEKLTGDIAELGVYKGNTAALLSWLARHLHKTAYLLDTFTGFSSNDLSGIDESQRMAFGDTSIEAVRNLVGDKSTVFVKGFFPETADQIPEGSSFVLVHLDCDLYAPMKAGLEYFYFRVKPHGFIIIHDYSSLRWPGVKRAVDEFFVDKTERVIPIPDKSGTVVVRRAAA